MVYIVTGNVNSGKTTKLLTLYNTLNTGDGFILPKVYIEGNYTGQKIVRLSNGNSKPFSLKREYLPKEWNELYGYGTYSFSKEGFDFAYSTIKDVVKNSNFPIFIDEIGPLELQQKGFYSLLLQLLNIISPIYISVRISLLEEIIKMFNIKEYKIFNV